LRSVPPPQDAKPKTPNLCRRRRDFLPAHVTSRHRPTLHQFHRPTSPTAAGARRNTSRPRESTWILWATALALTDGKTTALILDIDIQILTNQRADQIRNTVSTLTGLPVAQIRTVRDTHAFWARALQELDSKRATRWSGRGSMMSHVGVAKRRVTRLASLRTATVRTGRGECHINANRRCVAPNGERFLGVNARETCDHEVIVVKLEGPDRSPSPPSSTTRVTPRSWAPRIV
jgi:hypothetical protein